VNSSSAATPKQPISATLEGLDDFYDVESSPSQALPGDSKGTADDSEKILGIARWLTVEEAAKRLEISANAIIKRLGKGKLVGRKVPGQFGEKWMVDPSCLPQEVHVQIAEEETREQPGNSTGTDTTGQEQPQQHDTIAQKSFDVLSDVIRQQTEQIRLQNEMIKHLSGQVQEKDSQIKLLSDSRHKAGIWTRFCSWFTSPRQ
jgi:hypothetical protein